ncbi:thiol-disulfide oxidoreductase DCC family protein [Flavobacteriales bacterium]|nr:thiol-disulfide oxidoreductase DCC family protein [Flavobacteriales bacterium]
MSQSSPILLFDGVCNLCNSSVQFVLERNKKENIQFASLQSDFGQKMLAEINLPADYTSSLVLIEEGKSYVKSDAALRLAKHLNGLWKIGSVLLVFPKFISNPVYDWIAKNRYKWFGKKEVCWIPETKWQSRFLG